MYDENIEDLIDEKFPGLISTTGFCGAYVPKGWIPELVKLCENLYLLAVPGDLRIGQIKTKFGGLRVYLDSIEDRSTYMRAHELIDKTEAAVGFMCEHCGSTRIVAPISSGHTLLGRLCRDCTVSFYETNLNKKY